MVKSNISPHDLIRNAFTPQIGVICSPQVEIACKKNNLSFVEMLQPFCKLGTEIHFRDGTGTTTPMRNFRVNIVDVNYRPPHPVVAKQYLHAAVSQFGDYSKMYPLEAGEYSLKRVPYMVPWYDAWRETFLQVQYPVDHEFTKHFLACILVVSSSEPNLLGTLKNLVTSLNDMQNGGNTQSKLPKWFNKNVLRYYVILHETISGIDEIKLMETYDSIKATYDAGNCFLLKINSRAPPHNDEEEQQPPDPWAQFLQHRIPFTKTEGASPESQHVAFNPTMKATGTIVLDSAEEVHEKTAMDNVLYHPLSPVSEVNVDIQSKEFEMLVSNTTALVSSTALHGSCLSTEDVEQVKLFVHEFCTQALLPFLERQTHQLHELVATKKGVSKSLLTATKRWFSANKPNVSTINAVTYTTDSPEISVRKLGDLYFMVGVYSLAYQAYHTAKRDFNNDQAWVYYAAALEMAALAAFMANEPTKKTFDYMEDSITTYLNTCKLPQFATRATILNVECLKARHLHGQAAYQLNRMTSEESDLRSALLLEQAAYCFLHGASSGTSATDGNNKTCLVRKYAFHMVMSGHRYSKAAQRKHSLRCYTQAQEIYKNHGWRFAEDHIHLTIGRQANGTGQLAEALESYTLLLTGQNKQSPQQQQNYLTEYLNIYNTFLEQNVSTDATVLPLPLIDNESVKVLVGPATPVRSVGKVSALGITFAEEDATSRQKWNKLEEMIVQEAQGSLPLTFRPLVTLFTNDNISNIQPTAVLGEPIKVSVKLHNPLQILLHLTDVYLVWSFIDSGSVTITNEVNSEKDNQEQHQKYDETVKTHITRTIVLQANAGDEVILHLTPMCSGHLRLRGICYSIVSTRTINAGATDQVTSASRVVCGKRLFNLKGPKVKKENLAPDWRADNRLMINVVATAPCLQVSFNELASSDLLCNETQCIPVDMRNTGSIPIQRIFLATSVPHLLSSCDIPMTGGRRGSDDPRRYQSVDLAAVMDAPVMREREARANHVIGPLPLDARDSGMLMPGHNRNINIWIRAPNVVGPVDIDLVVYYESVDANVVPRYRVVRHIWHLVIQDSISLLAKVKPSCNSTDNQEMTIRVNTTNMNMVHHTVSTEISLLSISLLAKNWQLQHRIINTDVRKVLAQESIHLLLKATRDIGRNDNISVVMFEHDEAIQQYDRIFLDFARREDCYKINVFEELAKLQQQMQRTEEGRIVLKWKALISDSCGTTRTVFGQTSKSLDTINLPPPVSLMPFVDIPLDVSSFGDTTINKSSNLGIEDSISHDTDILHQQRLEIEKRQLNVNLVHVSEVRHNFGRSHICIIPVELCVHNMTDMQLTITIQTSGTSKGNELSNEHGGALCIPCATSEHYRWIRIGKVVRSVTPLGDMRVQLSVAVLAPGTYDLGARLQVWASKSTIYAPVLQMTRPHSALIVRHDY